MNTETTRNYLDYEGLKKLVEFVKVANATQDTEITSLKNTINAAFTNVDYNSDSTEFEFTTVSGDVITLDATPFIVDGMVESAAIEDGKLVITFNGDAEGRTIEVDLSEVFDVDNYYTKEEVDEKLENVVEYKDFGYNGENRKTIQLANYDNISGIMTTGEGVNLAMVSKWDVADFGSTKLHANLNTSDTVTINDKEHIVTYTVNANNGDQKVITFDNNQIIGAKPNTDKFDEYVQEPVDNKTWVALIQLNKWNVVDLGNPYLPTNINTPDGKRVTVQEKSQKGYEAHEVAYLDDIVNVEPIPVSEVEKLFE